ncbi:hypothetical protein [Micromonospora sp. NPDC049891]|uniref:hypothetical protein n=1 Tax=Micromonospora sp. NPDC049891 TaxID=3155655 RepID=UPI0033C27116
MREALFALAGTALGIVGTLLTDLWRARKADIRERRERLRNACVDFTAALVRLRQAFWGRGYDAEGRRTTMREAHDEARVQFERLRLSTTSLQVQEEARYALRYGYGLLRQLEGLPPREDEVDPSALDQLEDHLVRLFVEVRQELGVPRPHHVLSERAFFEKISPTAAVD